MEIKHIVVVDDDAGIVTLVADFLEQHGFRTSQAKNGPELLAFLDNDRVDLVVLDVMLPGEDGLSLCRKVEQRAVPVIFMSALTSLADKVTGLELGADDYLCKPFHPRELLARVRAVLRRSQPKSSLTAGEALPLQVERPEGWQASPYSAALSAPPQEVSSAAGGFCFAGWVLDCAQRCLIDPQHVTVELTAAEYKLLCVFLQQPQRILTRDELLEQTQGRSSDSFDRSIDVMVSRLRSRLGGLNQDGRLIKTVRGGGYVFTCGVQRKKP